MGGPRYRGDINVRYWLVILVQVSLRFCRYVPLLLVLLVNDVEQFFFVHSMCTRSLLAEFIRRGKALLQLV